MPSSSSNVVIAVELRVGFVEVALTLLSDVWEGLGEKTVGNRMVLSG